MPNYRCYFRDRDGRIKGAQVLDCQDDTAAAVKLELLFAERLDCVAAELWAGRRLLHRTSRSGTVPSDA
jgi:hypothetical protein